MSELNFKLEVFEGPLDLLLSLITKNKVDIYDIPISLILNQYMEYIEQMRLMDMEIAGEFIVMAADLMLIKSKMLLPKSEENEVEEDPRAKLVQALEEYKKAKEAAQFLSSQYEIFAGRIAKEPEVFDKRSDLPESIELVFLEKAFQRVLAKNSRLPNLAKESELTIKRLLSAKTVPVSAKIFAVMRKLRKNGSMNFEDILMTATSRSELVAIFAATLELLKVQRITMEGQDENIILSLNLKHLREVFE